MAAHLRWMPSPSRAHASSPTTLPLTILPLFLSALSWPCCVLNHIVTHPYRPPTLCGSPGAPPPYPREAASAARPADMRWSWTDTGSTACSGTCWWRTSLTSTSRSAPGQLAHPSRFPCPLLRASSPSHPLQASAEPLPPPGWPLGLPCWEILTQIRAMR